MIRTTPATAPTATLGLDLASQPKNTGVCAIEWTAGHADVLVLWRGTDDGSTPLHDHLIVDLMRGLRGDLPVPSKVAIDAPLGWPVDFVRAVSDPGAWPVGIDGDRKRLERRATDYWVRDFASKLPLSVTTDRIAFAAMRAAGLLAHYEATTQDAVDRTGMTGLICETYPDPAIRKLGLWPMAAGARDSYKGDASALRENIMRHLTHAAPWLRLSPTHHQACIESDDCLDALVCALVARAVQRHLTTQPPPDVAEEAMTEGWIHLPADDFDLPNLLDRP